VLVSPLRPAAEEEFLAVAELDDRAADVGWSAEAWILGIPPNRAGSSQDVTE
jgi:hypothetical protein